MRDRAQKSSPPQITIDKCLYGATYLPLDEAMSLQKLLSIDESVRIEIDNKKDNDFRENREDEENDPNQFEVISTKLNWITSIIYAQKLDVGHYGASMPTMPVTSKMNLQNMNQYTYRGYKIIFKIMS